MYILGNFLFVLILKFCRPSLVQNDDLVREALKKEGFCGQLSLQNLEVLTSGGNYRRIDHLILNLNVENCIKEIQNDYKYCFPRCKISVIEDGRLQKPAFLPLYTSWQRHRYTISATSFYCMCCRLFRYVSHISFLI